MFVHGIKNREDSETGSMYDSTAHNESINTQTNNDQIETNDDGLSVRLCTT